MRKKKISFFWSDLDGTESQAFSYAIVSVHSCVILLHNDHRISLACKHQHLLLIYTPAVVRGVSWSGRGLSELGLGLWVRSSFALYVSHPLGNRKECIGQTTEAHFMAPHVPKVLWHPIGVGKSHIQAQPQQSGEIDSSCAGSEHKEREWIFGAVIYYSVSALSVLMVFPLLHSKFYCLDKLGGPRNGIVSCGLQLTTPFLGPLNLSFLNYYKSWVKTILR